MEPRPPPDPTRRIVLHMGFHHCGGGQIRKALVLHRDGLAPHFAVATRAPDGALSAVAAAARDLAERPGPARRAALTAALAAWVDGLDLAPGQGLIASCDDLCGQMPGVKAVTGYAHAALIARATVAALRHRFGAALDLRLLYTTRGAEAWLRAVHWHQARQPGLDAYLDRFTRDHAKAADFGPVLAGLRAELPDLRIESAAVEAQSARRLGVVEALYDLAGVDAATRAALRRVPDDDVMPVHDLSDAFVALNRAGIPRPSLKRLKLALLASAELDRDLGA
jgi:hypothetical protein